jgi:uncharacterized protein (TIGR01244 family)
LVAPAQLTAPDMADAAARGVTLIVNNRPDDEEPGQPSAAELSDAAQSAGLAYVHIPVETEFSQDKVAALAEALAGTEGRALLFCKSGTRATYLWALARARDGFEIATLDRNARRAGYNLRPLMAWLNAAQES